MLLYIYNINHYDEMLLGVICSVAVFSLLCFIFKKERIPLLKKQYFKISNVFLLGFVIVHYQFYFDLILGNYSIERYDLIVNETIIIKSAIISTVALTSFCIGYVLKLNKGYEYIKNVKYRKVVFNLINFKYLIFLFLFLFILLTPFSYFMGGYITVERGAFSQYLETFLTLTIISFFVLKTRNLKIENKKVKSLYSFIKAFGVNLLILILIYLVLIMMSGDRGPLVSILCVFFGCYFIASHKKMNIFFVSLVVIFASILFSFFAYIRHSSDASNFTELIELSRERQLLLKGNQKSFSPSTFELSKSVRTLHAAVLYT